MQEYNIAFARLDYLIAFLHFAALSFLIGLQAAIWACARFFIKEQNANEEQYASFIKFFDKFYLATAMLLATLALSEVAISLGIDPIKSADPMANAINATKWGLEAFLAINLAYMLYGRKKAQKTLKNNESTELYESLIVIVSYFIPLNLAVSLVIIYLDVAHRGF